MIVNSIQSLGHLKLDYKVNNNGFRIKGIGKNFKFKINKKVTKNKKVITKTFIIKK